MMEHEIMNMNLDDHQDHVGATAIADEEQGDHDQNQNQKIQQVLFARPFTTAEISNAVTAVYHMCTNKPPHNLSGEMYELFKKFLSD